MPLNVRPVLGRRPKTGLKYDKTKHGDCAITIFRAVFKFEPECAAHDDCDKSEPAHAVTHASWEGEERSLDERNPNCLNGTRNDRVGDEPECNDGNEGPGEESLNDPPVSCRGENSGKPRLLEDHDHVGVASSPITTSTLFTSSTPWGTLPFALVREIVESEDPFLTTSSFKLAGALSKVI